MSRDSNRGPSRSLLRSGEGPTWLALAGCYAVWLAATWHHEALGLLWIPLAAVAAAFHSSLQHEALHGHPTRSAAVNEALVFPALGLLYPYRRFKETHLRHHDDTRLTDPYDDPESWYLAERDAASLSRPMRFVLELNRTLLGRMILGPPLGAFGLLRSDLRAIVRERGPDKPRRLLEAWSRHAAGMAAALVWIVGVCGIDPFLYLLAVAMPAAGLISVRTYYEHRAAETPARRTAIVEAGPFWSLLFLNNNLHAVHHDNPTLPWHRLPDVYRAQRDEVLEKNGGYRADGYGKVFARYAFRAREPIAHPLMRREESR